MNDIFERMKVISADEHKAILDYLRKFKTYLDINKIVNKFILSKEVEDPRKKFHPFKKYGPLRIQY